jgi:hypothetical protein
MSNKIIVSLPLYLSVPAAWLVRFIATDKTHVVPDGYLATRKMYLAKSMATMMQGALEIDGWDRILVWEADVLPPVDAINRIAAYPDSLDIVGGLVFQHDPPYPVIAYAQEDEDHFRGLHHSQVQPMADSPGIYPVGATGMGFTSIHRRVIEKWNPDVPMFGGENLLGHDMWFCREARRQGFGVHVDSGILCQHLSEVAIGWDDHNNAGQRVKE